MNTSAPVRHTCPDIDKCIKWINEAQKSIYWAINQIESIETDADVSSIIDELASAANQIDFEGVLEQLRNSNSELRDWGTELAKHIETFEQ